MGHFKVAIVGTRRPNPYTKHLVAMLAAHIARHAIVVSGGAIGVDAIAHSGAFPNTIMIAPSSLDIPYPRTNAALIAKIAKDALILSEYERDYIPQRHSFLERNRIVIALSDMVILPQGDLNSGTESSARIAKKLNKPIFTIPQRYGESELTNALLERGEARAIYNIKHFVKDYLPQELLKRGDSADSVESTESTQNAESVNDEILAFCQHPVNYDDALAKFGAKLLEYELLGLLVRESNTIRAK